MEVILWYILEHEAGSAQCPKVAILSAHTGRMEASGRAQLDRHQSVSYLWQVLKRTGANVYARSPAEWQQRCAAAAAVRSDFAAMLGDGASAAAAAGSAAGPEDAVDAEQEAAPPADGGKKAAKKRAKAAGSVAAPAAEADGAADEAEPPKKMVSYASAMHVDALQSPDPQHPV